MDVQLLGCPPDLEQDVLAAFGPDLDFSTIDGSTSDVVVLGPGVERPISKAQALFRTSPETVVLIAADPVEVPALGESLRFAPFVSIATRVIPATRDAVVAAIGDAVRRVRATHSRDERLAAADTALKELGSGTHDVDRLVERLHVRESFLAALVQSSSDAIVSLDLDGRVMSWNPAAEQLYGYPPDAIVGEPLMMIVPASRREEVSALLDRVRSGGTVTDHETVRLTADGREIAVAISMTPVRDSGGVVRWTSESGRDIEYRRRAERLLRHEERRKGAVVDSAIDGIITADHAGRILEFNRAAEQIFRFSAEDVIGRDIADAIVPPQHRHAHRAGLARYLATGESSILGERIELTAIRSDGSEFPVELGISAVDMDGPPLFTAHVRDITDRKRFERELIESHAALQRHAEELEAAERRARRATDEAMEAARRADETLDQASDALVAVDPEGRIVLFNKAAARLFGYPFDEVKNQPVELLVPPEFADAHVDLVQGFVRSGSDRRMMAPDRAVVMGRRKDGSEFPAAITVGPIDLGTGTTMGMAVVRDMSALVDAQQAVADALEAVEHRNAELEQFLYITAHDLKEPLRKVQTFGTELQEALTDMDEWAQHCLDRMVHAGRRMSAMLSALERYSQVASQPSRTQLQDLGRIVGQVLSDLSLRIAETEAEIEVDTLPVVHGDVVHLHHIFQNLIGNALKFTRDGEHPVIDVFARDHAQPGLVEVVVRDRGIGVDPRYVDRIFEPFRRLDDRYPGTGMGLAIASRVASLSGGSIHVEPGTGGVGTSMIVTLSSGGTE